jgi:peptide/nickel transport system permease protein
LRTFDWFPGWRLTREGHRALGVFLGVLTLALLALAAARFDRLIAGLGVDEARRGTGSLEPAAGEVAVAAWMLVVTLAAAIALDIALRRRWIGSGRPAPRWIVELGRNRLIVSGAAIIASLGFISVFCPLIAPRDPTLQGAIATERLLSPSWIHPLGTDRFGRDVFSRILYGSRISLIVGIASIAMSVGWGTLYGAIAGYCGGLVDAVLMRIVDALLCFPAILLVVACIGFVEERSLTLVVVTIGLVTWMDAARLVRGQVRALVRRDFFLAIRGLGAGSARLVFRHLLPNALTPIVVFASLRVGNVILAEAALSFLGLGVPPPAPSWGNIVDENRRELFTSWWIPFSAGFATLLTVLGSNLIGDGLRDVLDPRLARFEGGPSTIAADVFDERDGARSP